jgi:hypothetical protein
VDFTAMPSLRFHGACFVVWWAEAHKYREVSSVRKNGQPRARRWWSL